MPKTASLSKTQETLFWLNVVDIPPKPITKDDDSENQENYLQLAIRSRIKLFYRPTGLKQDAASAPEKLKWSKSGTTFTVKNPTPYYITISSINSEINGKSSDITPEGVMINPFSEQKIDIKNTNVGKLTFTTLNDYGSRVVNDLKLD